MKIIKICTDYNQSLLDRPTAYSFLNFASLDTVFNNNYGESIQFYCDGILMSTLASLILRKRIERVSFDYTSIAEPVFKYCQLNSKRIYLVGAKESELSIFITKLMEKYPGILLAGSQHGYFDNQEIVQSEIRRLAPELVVVGLGAGKQEAFIDSLMSGGFEGVAFSCGGFIRQIACTDNPTYYPKMVDKLNLRAFYRMAKEPHTIKRYLIDYPKNLIKLVYSLITKQIELR